MTRLAFGAKCGPRVGSCGNASRGVAAPLLEVLRPWLVVVAALVALGAAWAAYPEAWLRAWPAL